MYNVPNFNNTSGWIGRDIKIIVRHAFPFTLADTGGEICNAFKEIGIREIRICLTWIAQHVRY